jgi:hypothetical protein
LAGIGHRTAQGHRPLTDPTAHGGRARTLSTSSSLPYRATASPAGHRHRLGPERIAQAWAELMKRLGYTRYVAQGETGARRSRARWRASGLGTARDPHQLAGDRAARGGRGAWPAGPCRRDSPTRNVPCSKRS